MAFARKKFRCETHKMGNQLATHLYTLHPAHLTHSSHKLYQTAGGDEWNDYVNLKQNQKNSELVQKSIDCQIKRRPEKRREKEKNNNLVKSLPETRIIYQSNAELWEFVFKINCALHKETQSQSPSCLTSGIKAYAPSRHNTRSKKEEKNNFSTNFCFLWSGRTVMRKRATLRKMKKKMKMEMKIRKTK